MMAPAFAEAAAELSPSVALVKVDTAAAAQVASEYHIQSIPTLALLRGGNELARQGGRHDGAANRSLGAQFLR